MTPLQEASKRNKHERYNVVELRVDTCIENRLDYYHPIFAYTTIEADYILYTVQKEIRN